MSATLNQAEIAARIPHAGAMCLLDSMLSASSTDIVCNAVSHRNPDNPLRSHGRLGAAVAVEYAAQAMALHGSIVNVDLDVPSKGGRLINVRELTLHCARFDDLQSPLTVRATRLMGDVANVIYSFEVSADGSMIASGRAGVMLVANGGESAMKRTDRDAR